MGRVGIFSFLLSLSFFISPLFTFWVGNEGGGGEGGGNWLPPPSSGFRYEQWSKQQKRDSYYQYYRRARLRAFRTKRLDTQGNIFLFFRLYHGVMLGGQIQLAFWYSVINFYSNAFLLLFMRHFKENWFHCQADW